MIKLGQKVEDQITGFTGIVTGRVEYLTGCHQVLVAPRSKPEGDFDVGVAAGTEARQISPLVLPTWEIPPAAPTYATVTYGTAYIVSLDEAAFTIAAGCTPHEPASERPAPSNRSPEAEPSTQEQRKVV